MAEVQDASKKPAAPAEEGKKPFSWSQVVKDETKAPKPAGGDWDPTPTPAPREAGAAMPSYAKEHLVPPPAGAPSAPRPGGGEAKQNHGGSALRGAQTVDEVEKQIEEKLAIKDSGAGAPSGMDGIRAGDATGDPAPEASDNGKAVPAEASKPLKPAWGKGSSAVVATESATGERPAVLSTSATSWPTLGDSKTEPQKRGTFGSEAAAQAQGGVSAQPPPAPAANPPAGFSQQNSSSSGNSNHHTQSTHPPSHPPSAQGAKGGRGSNGGGGNAHTGANNGGSAGNGGGPREPTGQGSASGRGYSQGQGEASTGAQQPGGASGGNGNGGGAGFGSRQYNGRGQGGGGAGSSGSSSNASYHGRHVGGRGGQRNRGDYHHHNNHHNRGGGGSGSGGNNGGPWPHHGSRGRGRNSGGGMGRGGMAYRNNQNMAGQHMPPYYMNMPYGMFYGPPAMPAQPGMYGYMQPPASVPVQGATSGGSGGGGTPPGAPLTQSGSSLQVLEAVKVQVEYYFSVQNLVKDMYLRSKMDDNGWIPLPVIANFNRVRALAPDPAIIADALQSSLLVEVSAGRDSIRARDSWRSWVLPPESREGSQRPRSSPGSPVPSAQNAINGASLASMFPCTEISAEAVSRLSIITRLASQDPGKDSAALVMTNEIAAMVNNGVAVLESQIRSNQSEKSGVADAPVVATHFYPIIPMILPQQQQQQRGQQDNNIPLVAPSTFGSHIGWVLKPQGAATLSSSSDSTSSGGSEGGDAVARDGKGAEEPEGKPRAAGSKVGTPTYSQIEEFSHPAFNYLRDNNYVQMDYAAFKDFCVKQRADKGPANCPEMYSLYQFWGVFLRDVFNQSVYEEFRNAALEDHAQGWSFGLNCLFGLYHSRLLKEFRPTMFKDFEAIVAQEYKKGNHQVAHEFNAFCLSTGLVKPQAEGGS